MMDYAFHGKHMVHWQDPPDIGTEEDILVFEDALKETIPVKIKELVDRGEELILEREKSVKVADQMKSEGKLNDEFTEYFVRMIYESKYLEYHYVQRWLKYWLRLREIVFHTNSMDQIQRDNGRITDAEIERAKEVPIENFYDKKFRKVGNRLVGICPFHEESTPSFIIFTNDNHFHCFGCGKHGSVIDYLIYAKKMTWKDAILSLL